MNRAWVWFMQNSFALVLIVFFVMVFMFICYSFFDAAFSECNGKKESSINYYDAGNGAVTTLKFCTEGSHWIWEQDPGISKSAGK